MPTGIYKRTEKYRKIMSVALMGNKNSLGYKQSEETIKKLSGKNHHFFGKHFSEEHRQKISLSHLGKHHSEESKKKMSLARLGMRPTSETRKKLSLAGMGNKHSLGKPAWNKGKKGIQIAWNKGKKSSEATKLKISLARQKQVIPFHDTTIEIKLQNFLKEQNIEFVTHYPILGQPDIFIFPNICIFADGCYWHKCPECGFSDLIKNEKDQRITRELQTQGYTVIRLWEHDIKNMTTLQI